MVTYRSQWRLYLMLMGFWLILAGEVNLRQILTGLFSCGLTVVLYRWILRNSGASPVMGVPLAALVRYSGTLAVEIFRSALGHLLRIAGGRGETSVCRLRLSVSDELTVTMIANAITLTPGTVTLEADKGQLTVLCYGHYKDQCPMDLVLMTERLQKPFLNRQPPGKAVEHA